jgi:hypothetical protein
MFDLTEHIRQREASNDNNHVVDLKEFWGRV